MVKYLKIEMTILQFQIQENSAFCSSKYKPLPLHPNNNFLNLYYEKNIVCNPNVTVHGMQQ